MAHIIAVINQKGGVGKTTTACNLAYTFSQRNKKTLLIDFEPSANTTGIYLKSLPQLTIQDFLLKKHIGAEILQQAIINDEKVENLFIIPSHISLAVGQRDIASRAYREMLLARKLSDSSFKAFDYIIIDCPPTLGDLTVIPMFAANFILIPIKYEKYALEGVSDLFQVLNEIKEGHDFDFRILRNGFDARKKHTISRVDTALADFLTNEEVFQTIIRQDEALNMATWQDEPVDIYSSTSRGSQDFSTLANELQEILSNG